ncbi:hypothetical protein SKAU_G00082460 [Synaphobranchus kaupii]|uniref:Uncharacterized protein n=1 Tax=Synaphobranchus kaupii TaxID=118154 RepID=A0A9Q1FVX5_SYNKA|nr:hypothetical protein SKAU_G00082460 [Synaphobranchus kaupii]
MRRRLPPSLYKHIGHYNATSLQLTFASRKIPSTPLTASTVYPTRTLALNCPQEDISPDQPPPGVKGLGTRPLTRRRQRVAATHGNDLGPEDSDKEDDSTAASRPPQDLPSLSWADRSDPDMLEFPLALRYPHTGRRDIG